MLEIEKKNTSRGLEITLKGSLDYDTHKEFEDFVDREIESNRHLVLDMTDVDYVSSAGFGAILYAQKIMLKKGDMLIENVQPHIIETMESIGFLDVMNVK